MPAFKAPDLNERAAAARDAKLKALEKLKAKPPVDPAVVAERAAARAAKEAAEAEKRAAKKAAQEEAKALARLAAEEKRAEAERIAEANRKPEKPKLTPEEQKALRDARYAARKARKK